jgi:hypothetical protein
MVTSTNGQVNVLLTLQHVLTMMITEKKKKERNQCHSIKAHAMLGPL